MARRGLPGNTAHRIFSPVARPGNRAHNAQPGSPQERPGPLAINRHSRATDDRLKPTPKPSGFPPDRGSHQQELAIMQTTSRRTLLAGAAMLPALAVPAFAADPALSFEEVKRLYAELDPETKKFFRALTL